VVNAVIRLTRCPEAQGKVFNIGSDSPVSILQLAEKVIAEAATSSTIQFQSYAEAYNTDFEDIRRRIPDLSRIHSAIGYVPRYDLEHIIRELIVAKRRSSDTS